MTTWRFCDPGHLYLLTSFDGGKPIALTFVKRNDPPEKYPGNVDAHPGTQSQEVLRALIERNIYVYNQTPCDETHTVIFLLRLSLFLLESRHMVRHGSEPELDCSIGIDNEPFCPQCGHIMCYCTEGKQERI